MVKSTVLWFLAAIIVILVGGVLVYNGGDFKNSTPLNDGKTQAPIPTPTVTPASVPSDGSEPTTKTAPPEPYLKIEEVRSYEYLFNQMNPENRVLVVEAECRLIVPSNLAHKNNTQIMLDNTNSTQNHKLKIGDKEYSLEAGGWILTTLSSPVIPIKMQIFCEGIELGQLDLE